MGQRGQGTGTFFPSSDGTIYLCPHPDMNSHVDGSPSSTCFHARKNVPRSRVTVMASQIIAPAPTTLATLVQKAVNSAPPTFAHIPTTTVATLAKAAKSFSR